MDVAADGESLADEILIECECLDGFKTNPLDTTTCLDNNATVVPYLSMNMNRTNETNGTTSAPVAAPTHAPTWQACVDGDHGCDPYSTRCVSVTAGLIIVTTCNCLEGYVELTNSTTHCELVQAAPTPNAFWGLNTPAPTPVQEPAAFIEGCDAATTKPSFNPFCHGDDRRLALWQFPNSATRYCEKMSLKENVSSLGDCQDYCGHTLGGPPVCTDIKYDSHKEFCYWAPDCSRPREHDLEHEHDLRFHDHESENIYGMQCSFRKNLYQTCLWANEVFPEEYDLSYTPSAEEHDEAGWKALRELVGRAGNDPNASATASASDPWSSGTSGAGDLPVVEVGHLRRRRLNGVDAEGNEVEEVVVDDADETYGLIDCLRRCETEEHCRFIAYNQIHISACLLLGELHLPTFKQNCGYTFESIDSFEEELEEELESGEPLQDVEGNMAHVALPVQELLSGFFLYMVRDADFTLYEHHTKANMHVMAGSNNASWSRYMQNATRQLQAAQAAEILADDTCACKVGHVRLDSKTCVRKETLSNCTEVTVRGPISLDGQSKKSFHEQVIDAYKDCIIFWDCNKDGRKNSDEVQCVMSEDATCLLDKPAYDIEGCDALYSNLLQTGRNCMAASVLDGETEVALQIEIKEGLPDGGMGQIELGVAPTKSPTAPPTPPTLYPTSYPTATPTDNPTKHPTPEPTENPTLTPTQAPSKPTSAPTSAPTSIPTSDPTKAPSVPTTAPSPVPTAAPTSGYAIVVEITVSDAYPLEKLEHSMADLCIDVNFDEILLIDTKPCNRSVIESLLHHQSELNMRTLVEEAPNITPGPLASGEADGQWSIVGSYITYTFKIFGSREDLIDLHDEVEHWASEMDCAEGSTRVKSSDHAVFCIEAVGPIINIIPPGAQAVPTRSPTPAPCELCQSHSCHEIEVLNFTEISLTSHQSKRIAFGFDQSIDPGSVRDTVSDTIGACIFCEHGSSADASTCIFTEPEETAKHWPVCDPLCAFTTCTEIEDLISKHFLRDYTEIGFKNVQTYVERFMTPLCYACPSTYPCSHYGLPEGPLNRRSEAEYKQDLQQEEDDEDDEDDEDEDEDEGEEGEEQEEEEQEEEDQEEEEQEEEEGGVVLNADAASVEEAAAPVEQTAAPVEEAAAPVEEAAVPGAPVVDAKKAAGASVIKQPLEDFTDLLTDAEAKKSQEDAANINESSGAMASLMDCIGNHQCDTKSSTCRLQATMGEVTKLSGSQDPLSLCLCKNGYTPNPADPTSCLTAAEAYTSASTVLVAADAVTQLTSATTEIALQQRTQHQHPHQHQQHQRPTMSAVIASGVLCAITLSLLFLKFLVRSRSSAAPVTMTPTVFTGDIAQGNWGGVL
jgi:hypothetical protein